MIDRLHYTLSADAAKTLAAAVRLLACAFACVVLIGCAKIAENAAPPLTSSHGVLRIGSFEDLDSLNPVLSDELFVTGICQFVYSGLIDYDDRGLPVPDVALALPTQANGLISRDGRRITYHLRRGVLFSDGVPLTSADVKFTYDQIMNMRNNVPYRQPYDDVTAIETPDPYTLIVHLKEPSAPFVGTFMHNGIVGAIVPKHLLGSLADLNHASFNNHPVGSGPFIVKSWQPGALLDLVANPRYWRGPPRLREIQFEIIPNQNTLLTLVRSGGIDLYFDAPESQAAALSQAPGYRVTAVANMNYEHIAFNCARPPFDDRRVRRAMAFAIDWQRLQHSAYHGIGHPGMTDISPLSWAYDPSIQDYPHDPAQARVLLDQAGWVPGPDGVRSKNGMRLSVTIASVTGVSTRAAVEALIQSDLRSIGVEVLVHNYPANLLFAPLGANGVLASGKFDLALYGWSYTVPDPDDTSTLGPGSVPPNGVNYAFYVDTRLGGWQREARMSYDIATRKRSYAMIQRRIHDEVPIYTIIWRANVDAVNIRMRNFKPAPAISDFWNSYEWEI
jgi:peptide/nickel transport system substrate-binding protein